MSDCVYTVDEIERITGIDFYPLLNDNIEDRVEADARLSDW
jgi:endonuclease G